MSKVDPCSASAAMLCGRFGKDPQVIASALRKLFTEIGAQGREIEEATLWAVSAFEFMPQLSSLPSYILERRWQTFNSAHQLEQVRLDEAGNPVFGFVPVGSLPANRPPELPEPPTAESKERLRRAYAKLTEKCLDE